MVAVHGRHDGRAESGDAPGAFGSTDGVCHVDGVGSSARSPVSRRCSNFSAAGMLIVPTLITGGSVTLLRGFTPADWLAAVERDRITLSLLVPTMIYVLDHPDLETTDLSTLETVMYGASPMSPAACRGHRAHGSGVAQLYGQTECAGITSSMSRSDHIPTDMQRLSACGLPMPGVRVEIFDEDGNTCPIDTPGEVCARASVMDGYWRQRAHC